MNIDLTILMFSYNHALYIRQAFDSILIQKTKYNYKIIITDDASTDGTTEIIKEYAAKYPEKIKAIINEENCGNPWLILINNDIHLNSNYWCILETDDYWISENKIEKQLNFLYEHPQFVGSTHAYLTKNEVTGVESIEKANLNQWDIYLSLRNIIAPVYNLYCHTSTWIYKNVFIHNHSTWINFMRDKRIWSDVLINYRIMSYGGKVKYCDKVMSCYRFTGKGIWTSLSEEERKNRNSRKSLTPKIINAIFLRHKFYYYTHYYHIIFNSISKTIIFSPKLTLLRVLLKKTLLARIRN